ncbi:MAG TPA: EAL domain-containing protein [Candidatus Limnocylindria bacterium]|nr:EAL domain-containing protein [Candidatus Limnocylindria bacterium]
MSGGARFELERAITQNELELHYQPIFEMEGRGLWAAEALVRWRHAERGLVSPVAFLPTAEREGLMHDLTAWVLREALLQNTVWRRDGLTIRVAVNIDMFDLRDPRFRRMLDRTLYVTRGDRSFVAEVHADDDEPALGAMSDLRGVGASVALDNVTSPRQLERTKEWPLDAVKIGRDLIARAVSDPAAAAAAGSIRERAQERGMSATAVGVEDEAALSFARSIGCVGAQGYHLAPPMTGKELTRLVRARA